MSDWPFLLEFARSHGEGRLALATLVACEGSSYRPPGARMIVAADGRFCGSLSGGCLEEGIAEVAGRVIRTGQPEVLQIDTRPHFGCPGVLRIFIEVLAAGPDGLMEGIARLLRERRSFQVMTAYDPAAARGSRLAHGASPAPGVLVQAVMPPPRLVAIGWTSDMNPILRIAGMMGWECHRVLRDHRLLAETQPVAGEEIALLSPQDLVQRFRPDGQTAVLIMTHHLATDLGYLKAVFPLAWGYVGLLGSRRRRETLLAELGETGLLEDDAALERFHAPVGLDLGGDHPAAIALAVVAEIQAVLAGRRGGSLKERAGAIHRTAPV